MKKAALLHGTDGTPEDGWRPYIKAELEELGYEVWVPLLPGNHTPNMSVYNNFLLGTGWDFTDNLVIGHSSGAVATLNLLMDPRCPKIQTAVMVGAWAQNDQTDLDAEQFKDTFPPEGFDFAKIKSNSSNQLFIHGDNDPYCPLDQAKWLAKQLSCEIVVIPNGGHLGADHGYREFPQLIEILNVKKYL